MGPALRPGQAEQSSAPVVVAKDEGSGANPESPNFKTPKQRLARGVLSPPRKKVGWHRLIGVSKTIPNSLPLKVLPATDGSPGISRRFPLTR